MMRASEIDPSKNISFLLKGPPGEGKSIAAASFATGGEVFYAYIDKKSAPELVTFFTKIGRADLLKQIDIRFYSSHNINMLLNDMIKMQQEPGKYFAGVLDSVTSLTKSAVNWSLAFRPLSKSNESGEKQKENIMPGFDEYKVETSLVCQLLDLYKALPWYNIWLAHPLPQLKMEATSSGRIESITKTSSLVTYGSKVAGIIPGEFTEHYHFGRQGGKRVIWTDMTGEDFAKTSLPLPRTLDVDGKLFYEVWKETVNKGFENMEVNNAVETPKLSIDAGTSTSRWKV